jgi:hypothetical protein
LRLRGGAGIAEEDRVLVDFGGDEEDKVGRKCQKGRDYARDHGDESIYEFVEGAYSALCGTAYGLAWEEYIRRMFQYGKGGQYAGDMVNHKDHHIEVKICLIPGVKRFHNLRLWHEDVLFYFLTYGGKEKWAKTKGKKN